MRHTLLLLASIAALPLLACGSSVGDTCASDGCGSDLMCRGDFPGGFCTTACTQAGEGGGCPDEGLCAEQLGQLMCSPRCESTSDCREGYACNGVSGTNLKACQVKL
jgi:hypothetical protein